MRRWREVKGNDWTKKLIKKKKREKEREIIGEGNVFDCTEEIIAYSFERNLFKFIYFGFSLSERSVRAPIIFRRKISKQSDLVKKDVRFTIQEIGSIIIIPPD